MNDILVFSSATFALIILYSFYVRHYLNHHIYILLLVTSLIHHCRPDHDFNVVLCGYTISRPSELVIALIDKLTALLAFASSLLDYACLSNKCNIHWTIVFQIVIVVLYMSEPTSKDPYTLHLLLHCTVVAGAITNMWLLRQCYDGDMPCFI